MGSRASFSATRRRGTWCGYVGVAPGHPQHGVDNDAVDVHVYGGVTYSAACQGHICHVPEPGEPDAVWWFGFDCGHAFDLMPAVEALLKDVGARHGGSRDVYRDLAYVRVETERLAEQLAKSVT